MVSLSAMERERETEREKARKERLEMMKQPERITPTFTEPIRVADPTDDMEIRLQNVLGPYKTFRPIIDSSIPSSNIIGVPNQLATPTTIKLTHPLRTSSPKTPNSLTESKSKSSSPYNKDSSRKDSKIKKNGVLSSSQGKSSSSSNSHQKHPGKTKNVVSPAVQSSSSQHRSSSSSSHTKTQDTKTTPVKSERTQNLKSPASKEKSKPAGHTHSQKSSTQRALNTVKIEPNSNSAKTTPKVMQKTEHTEQKSKSKSKDSSSSSRFSHSETRHEVDVKNMANFSTLSDSKSSIFDVDEEDSALGSLSQHSQPSALKIEIPPLSKTSQTQGRSIFVDDIFKEMIDIQCPLTALPTPSKPTQTQFPFSQTIKTESGHSRPAMIAPHKKQPEHPEKNTDEQSNENGSDHHNMSSDDENDDSMDHVRNNGGAHEDGSPRMKRTLSSSSGSSSESDSESESSDSDVSVSDAEEDTNEQVKTSGKWSLSQYVQKLHSEQNKSPGVSSSIPTSNGPRFFSEQDGGQRKSPGTFGRSFELPTAADSGSNKDIFNKYDHFKTFRDLSEKAQAPTLQSEKAEIRKSTVNTKSSNPTVAPRKEQVKDKQKSGKTKGLPKKTKPSSKPIASQQPKSKSAQKHSVSPMKSPVKGETKKVTNSKPKVEPNSKNGKSKKTITKEFVTPEFVVTSSDSEDDDNISEKVYVAPQPQKSRSHSVQKLSAVSRSPAVVRSPGVSRSPAVSHASSDSRTPEQRQESKKASQDSKKSSNKLNKPRTNKEKSSSTKLKKISRTTEEIFNNEITEQILSPIKSSSEHALSKSHIVYKEDGNPSLVVRFDLENLDNIPRKRMPSEAHDEVEKDGREEPVHVEEPKPVTSVRVQKRKPEQVSESEERQRVGIKKPKLLTKSKSPRAEGVSTPHDCDETPVERNPVLERQSSVTSMCSLQSEQSVKSEKPNSASKKRKQPSISRTKSTQKDHSKIREWDAPTVKRERRPEDLESTNKMSRTCSGAADHDTRPSAVVRPRPRVEISERPMGVDDYLKEAKKLKHFADALADKSAKAPAYVDAVLYFILCGNAMEDDQHISDEKPLTMYTDTIELIKFIHRFKDPRSENVAVDKKLTVLCFRCQAILYMRMFRLRKDAAWKHSQHLKDYFKNVSKTQQAPSPWNSSKCTGTPSPMSPTPSPAGSVGSIGSQSSTNGDPFSSSSQNRLSNGMGLMSPASVSISQKMHTVMSSYFTITNHHLYSLDLWEKAETCLQENAEFFRELDQECGALSLYNSTLIDLVKYVRAGLRWLKET
ncbi:AF4/FMR2 family member 4-like isoform X2 [Anneissia japonica]|uniref:AF4/FMR2 family member 4-like isoform X2 n=1 Tax=Anneissia japonica TaxID=1529436 RepID=UPI00142572F3|nr:AF4/FMR2 family member 4-like isoform X2 [Anneissia japonica]